MLKTKVLYPSISKEGHPTIRISHVCLRYIRFRPWSGPEPYLAKTPPGSISACDPQKCYVELLLKDHFHLFSWMIQLRWNIIHWSFDFEHPTIYRVIHNVGDFSSPDSNHPHYICPSIKTSAFIWGHSYTWWSANTFRPLDVTHKLRSTISITATTPTKSTILPTTLSYRHNAQVRTLRIFGEIVTIQLA